MQGPLSHHLIMLLSDLIPTLARVLQRLARNCTALPRSRQSGASKIFCVLEDEDLCGSVAPPLARHCGGLEPSLLHGRHLQLLVSLLWAVINAHVALLAPRLLCGSTAVGPPCAGGMHSVPLLPGRCALQARRSASSAPAECAWLGVACLWLTGCSPWLPTVACALCGTPRCHGAALVSSRACICPVAAPARWRIAGLWSGSGSGSWSWRRCRLWRWGYVVGYGKPTGISQRQSDQQGCSSHAALASGGSVTLPARL